MKKARLYSDVLAEFRKIHGDRYEYVESSYINMKTPMIMICKDHGEFRRSPIDHIRLGYGCRKCSIIEVGKNKRITWDEFVKRATEIHQGKYEYLGFVGEEFTGYNCFVEIKCPEHGIFQQQVKYHIAGSGCPICGIIKSCAQGSVTENNITELQKCGMFSTEEYLKMLPAENFELYDYSRTIYRGGKKDIEIGCKKHNDWFWQNATKHRKGSGCPKCAREKSRMMPTSLFFDRCRKEHGDNYIYDEFSYTGSRKKILYRCKTCNNVVHQQASTHKNLGYGCPHCKTSTGERELLSFIRDVLCISNVKTHIRTILPDGKELDLYLPDFNLAIEYNGTYFHSELGGNTPKEYHHDKTAQCEKLGITLIHIFEDEWKYRKDVCKSIIRHKLQKTENVKYARDCYVREIDAEMKNDFLHINHLQGEDLSQIKLGLFDSNDDLVAVMCFKSPRFKNNQERWELSRFCVRINTKIIGAASKLFKHFINECNPDKIVSYADLRWSSGELYNRLGFTLSHKTPPRCFYLNRKNYVIREHSNNYSKDLLLKNFDNVDTSKTEWEIMQELNYDRIWDCGLAVYIWYKVI